MADISLQKLHLVFNRTIIMIEVMKNNSCLTYFIPVSKAIFDMTVEINSY